MDISTPPGFGADRMDRLAAFADGFREVFPRADQHLRFRAYLAGLLAPGGRKNVGAIAARVADLLPPESDPVQALQHFVTRSPWDPDRLAAAYRRALAGPLSDPAGVWVVHDAVFPKRGRHSVGVQRQFARSLGRKVNCQVAVVVSQLGPNGFFPLAARLYLPAGWLRENPGVAERAVPSEHRRPASKGAVAAILLDTLRAEGWAPGTRSLVPEPGYAAALELTDGLAGWGLTPADGPGDDPEEVLADTRRRLDDLRSLLGLDHFEGRTWVGWHHHVSLVFTAYAFLAAEKLAAPVPAVVSE